MLGKAGDRGIEVRWVWNIAQPSPALEMQVGAIMVELVDMLVAWASHMQT